MGGLEEGLCSGLTVSISRNKVIEIGEVKEMGSEKYEHHKRQDKKADYCCIQNISVSF